MDLTCFNWVQLVKKSNLPSNAKLLSFYLATFMNAEHDIAWPSQTRISYETGLSRSTVCKWIDYLVSEDWLIKDSRKHLTMTAGGPQSQNEYTINVPRKVVLELNTLAEGCTTDEQRLSVHRQKDVRQPDTNNNINNNNNKTSEKYSDVDLKTAEFIYGKILKLNPGHKKPNMTTWANNVRLMVSRDGKTHEEIKDLFTWANNHDFWGRNILSPSSLRKQWDKLTIQKGKPKPYVVGGI